jgi:multidrug resistance efflux pump
MADTQTEAKSGKTATERDVAWSPKLPARHKVRPRLRIIPVLITLVTVALAVALGWAMWDAYMGAPWTRDGTVRVYIVTMAPEVAGRIVEFPVADNQFVHKGDLLMVIDPRDYTLAVSRAGRR